MLQQLVDELQLTAEQQTQVDQIAQQYFQEMRDQRQNGPASEETRQAMEKMRTLRRDLREAQAAGDQPKVDQLNKELEDLRQQGPGAKQREELLAKIEPILTPEQLQKYNQIKEQLLQGRGAVDLTNPAILGRAVHSLQLTEEQRGKIDELFEQYRTGRAQAGREVEAPEQQELGKKLYDDVLKVLTEEQVAQLKRWRPQADVTLMLRNPRVLKRLVDRLELTDEQKTEIQALYDRLESDQRNLSPSNMDARQELGQKFHDDVMKLLTDEQKQQVQQRASGFGSRFGPGQRPGQPPAPPAPPAE